MSSEFEIPRMLTIRATAELFNLPVHFIRAKAASGEIVVVRAGRKILVNAESVAEFLRTGKPQGTVAASRNSDKENAPRVMPISLR